jgi:Domain of unknown function (DUF4384)
MWIRSTLVASAAVLPMCVTLCFGQQDQTKSLRAPEYANRRPATAVVESGGAGGGVRNYSSSYVRVRVRKRKPAYKVVKPPPRQSETARLGFTVWRVEKAVGPDNSKSLTEHDDRSGAARRVERLDPDAALAVGDSVRIGVESLTHPGYLYIIDREKYADGTYGSPTLVYPTLRYRNGDNYVRPGDVTFLPGPGREITISSDSARKQSAEELTIIVSPTRLIDVSQLQMEQIMVSPNQLLEWIKKWSAEEIQLDQVGAAGLGMTAAERAAGADQPKGLNEHPLSQSDPLPQTMLEMKIKRGSPMITTVTLPIKQG